MKPLSKAAAVMAALLIPLAALTLAQEEKTLPPENGDASPQPAVPQAMPVMVVTIAPGEATFSQDLPGRVSALRTAEVRARVDGIVQSRTFTEGSDVAAGDLLFKIDDRMLKANVRTAKADVDTAEASHALNQQTLKRYARLLKVGTISQQEYDTYLAQTKQSSAQVEQAKARLESAEISLDYASVSAPISGRIGRAMVSEGALVSAGTSTQLAKIEQTDKVYVDFSRSSSEAARIRQALKNENINQSSSTEVEIKLGDHVLQQKGMLEFAAMEVDAATGALSLRAVVDNPNRELLPGMFVRVKVPVATANQVIKVPQKAVEITPNGAVVYTVVDSQLSPLPIELGPMADGDWVVKSGLTVGTQVVVSDITLPKSMQMPVMPMPVDQEPGDPDAELQSGNDTPTH